MIDRLYCGKCHELFRYKNRVFLDIHNGMLHQRCYQPDVEIKDSGTYKEIVNRYPFFDHLRLDGF